MTDAELFMKMRAAFRDAEAFVEAVADRLEDQAAEIERLRDERDIAELRKLERLLLSDNPNPWKDV